MIFEEYIKLLESFKHNQISKILEQIDTKVFDLLYSKHVSPQIIPYFPHYELCLMSDATKLEAGKLYIREKNGKIAYSVITPKNEEVKDVILEDLDAPIPFTYSIGLIPDDIPPEKGSFYARITDVGLEYTVLDPKGKLIKAVIKKEELNINLRPDFAPKDLEPFMPEILSITSKRHHTFPFSSKTLLFPFKYKIGLMPDKIIPPKGSFYARITSEGLEYTALDPKGVVVTDVIKKEELSLNLQPGFAPKDLEPFMPQILSITSKRNHTLPFTLDAFRARVLSAASRKGDAKWAPFTNYELDPDNISQIKKLINALYYARLTFLDLEHIDVRNAKRSYSDLQSLYSKTINLAYEASYLLTHLDVDLRDMFNEELALILPVLNQVQTFAANHDKEQQAIVKALEPMPLAFQVGEIAGIAADQMRPISGDIDYNFLTQFSMVLPSYIGKLTKYIEQFSSDIKKSEPKLNQKKLAELQKAALSLLNEIENLKGNRVMVSLKFLNYIHIISNIITLSMSTLEQIGELSESSQDLIRNKLEQLKYEVLPTLFGLADKIEDNAMLKPGTLSVPLMEKIKTLYKAILYLPKKVIDFKTKGADLLEIEDPHFIELRLEMTYKRIDKNNKELYKIEKAKDACKQFFAILKSERYKNLRLYQLPPTVKKALITRYKLIKPYMAQLDIDFNELVISGLTGPAKEGWYSFMGKPIRWIKKQLPADHISFVLAKEEALNNLITKNENSKLFHIKLNKDIIDSVYKKANLVLFPYSEKTNVYSVDESIPLQIEQEKDKKARLTKSAFQEIQNAYLNFVQIIKEQIEAKPELYAKNLDLSALEAPAKEKCRLLFNVFQPYLGSITPTEFKDSAKSFELYLSNFFANKPTTNIPAKELFLDLDKNVQNFFDQLNFEWFDKNEFQKVLTAYTRFSEIVKKQIETKPQLYGSNLLLTGFDEDAKKQCRELFPVFQPYFKFAIPPELKDSAQNFEKYLTAFLANKPIEILEAPPVSLFLKLDKHTQEFFAKWKDKSLTYYDFAHARFLDEKESEALKIKRKEDATLHFRTIDGDKLLLNHGQLTADQALELREWYKNKRNKFLVVKNAYSQFLKLLYEEIKKNPKIQGNISHLSYLSPEVKAQFRNLYSIFQPYLIGSIPPEQKAKALHFDKYLVASLSNETLFRKKAPPIQTLMRFRGCFRDTFIRVSTEWNRRTERFSNLTKKKFTRENNKTVLKPTPKTGREHYVIPNTDFSKYIHDFKQSLFEVTKLFNHAMQDALTPNALRKPKMMDLSPTAMLSDGVQIIFPPSAVPFPEMEDNNQRLAQSKQVCALKDIFNSLFHLEGIVLKLEDLNNQSIKSRYVYHLLQAYGHLNEIIKAAQRLAADPHLGFIARDLLNKAQNLYATLQEHSDAYQVSPEQVPYGPDKVQFNSLWYVLNTFYISPKHIRALKNTNYMTTEELNELHLRAKKATLIIENLINSSDSYFKLFLQTPNMIYLYQELTAKLTEFTSTSHDAILDNLGKMQSTVFTPMLLEADRWENRLGLAPGILSGPLRQITNEFFKGLLHPLDLKSKTRIGLICDKEPLEKRIALTKKQISRAQKYAKKIDKDHEDIENLYQWYLEMTTPIDLLDITAPQKPKVPLNIAKEQLCAAYKKALPKLAKLKKDKKVEIASSQYPEDHKLDQLCNSGLKAYDPHFTEIEALIVASHHYYLGLKATQQMRLNTAEERLVYLMNLAPIQKEEKTAFVEQYTTESFDKHCAVMCNRHIGLEYIDEEYRGALKAYLLTLRNNIIAKAKTSKDIDRSIKKLLEIEISKFEKKFYVQYYQLDAIRDALTQFKIYFSYSRTAIANQSSISENNNTLNPKSDLIVLLEKIAKNPALEISERLAEIKKKVDEPLTNFSGIILATHPQVETFSFAYLKMCFLSLLEALNLYTPTRQKLHDNLNDAVHNPPEISVLTKRFGLFAATKTAKDAEPKRYDAPAMPAISSTAP
ncbi:MULTISPECIES: SdhA [Legionella]|uniref:SdhA n=1 Tax=Legionella TaxID=445 RepID=UPI00095F06F5|nr:MULTISPECIES: SdhA [Legionella]MBN9228845.1 SdhA [Legionella steelei]OJW07026.1 MAG: SdhA [Legionella sp. 39-23]